MFLSSEELILFHSKTQYYSTKKLHELEYYLRYKNKCPVYNQLHEIVEMILITRGEINFLKQRIEKVNYLDKCFSLSNPFGRFSARVIGYFCKFVDKGKIINKVFNQS